MPTEEVDVVILGGGLCGMAAATALGDRAVVIERAARPGGLARTEETDGYWFDHVLHLLHFRDPLIEELVQSWIGDVLAPCPPVAGIDCAGGTVRYPFQLHLADLHPEAAALCLDDFLAAQSSGAERTDNYEQMLLGTFGAAMCEQFFFPYNRKLWKRPLCELAPTGFQWNIAQPTIEEVVRGASAPDGQVPAYNSNGWYPRPPADAPYRGMEVLSRAMAERVDDLRLGTIVDHLDLEQRSVILRDRSGRRSSIRYREACLSTLPLPATVQRCRQASAAQRATCLELPYNRVRTVAVAVKGPRPSSPGLWHYYTDPNIIFTRLINVVGFDPGMAPSEGWGLMAEVPERGDRTPMAAAELINRVRADIHLVGAIPSDCTIIRASVMDTNPAYVVFTRDNRDAMIRARSFLRDNGVSPVGRYGRWEYSSMAQVIGDGWRWAQNLGWPSQNEC